MTNALPTTPITKLASDLDRLLRTARNLLRTSALMGERNQLGEAAKVPDELARAIACIADARNAASHEAHGVSLTTEDTAA